MSLSVDHLFHFDELHLCLVYVPQDFDPSRASTSSSDIGHLLHPLLPFLFPCGIPLASPTEVAFIEVVVLNESSHALHNLQLGDRGFRPLSPCIATDPQEVFVHVVALRRRYLLVLVVESDHPIGGDD